MSLSPAPPDFPGCAACSGPVRPVFHLQGFEILECGRCQHRMTRSPDPAGHVARVYGDDYFFGGGAGYPNYLRERSLLIARGRWYAHRLRRWRAVPGRLFDVGAAAGFTLQGFADAGWRGAGIEPNARMAAYARDALGLDVRTGVTEELTGEPEYDLISMLQVIPHLVDPAQAVRQATRLLVPGGLVLIETWSWQSRTARLSGRRWHEYSPPSVLHWFCPTSLDALMGRIGFHRLYCGRARKRISLRHACSLLAYRLGQGRLARAFSALGRTLPEKLTLPYPFDDLRWYLFAGGRRRLTGPSRHDPGQAPQTPAALDRRAASSNPKKKRKGAMP